LRDGYAVLRALLPPGRRNVRDDALDPRFLAIVREHGVLAAVTRSAPTTVPRSTTASAGLATIPVYVIDPGTTDPKAATAERIAVQIVTNDQCATLTDAQRAEGTVSL
jgi:hypothetical protein